LTYRQDGGTISFFPCRDRWLAPPRPFHHSVDLIQLSPLSLDHLFPHVTRACKGVPLETIETVKHYIEKTETTKGLNVVVRMLDKVYQAGRKYAKDFKQNMTIKFEEYLPKWNYTAIPDGR